MPGLYQLFLVSCILFSVATLTTAVPFDRQQGLSGSMYTKNISSDSENVCMIDDVLYQVGDPIPTASPCEKCVCRPPGFACSIITCEKRPNCRALQRSNQCCPEYKCDCEINGKVYHNGEKLDNTQNPCKVCYCQGGEIACTVIECYKRDDCIPKHVPGMCCPKYDNCPPRDPARSASSSLNPSVEPTNTTAAREVPKFREVADDRLNLLGEPEPTNQLRPEKPISNNIYDIPQGDEPQVYEVYDESSTSSTSTTGFLAYEYGLTSTTNPFYDSYDENSSTTVSSSSPTTSSSISTSSTISSTYTSSTSSSSTYTSSTSSSSTSTSPTTSSSTSTISSTSSSTSTSPTTSGSTSTTSSTSSSPSNSERTTDSTPWTYIPTFPKELETLEPEWLHTTSSSTQDDLTEYFPTWGPNYSTHSSTSTQNTDASSSNNPTESVASTKSTDSSNWTETTDISSSQPVKGYTTSSTVRTSSTDDTTSSTYTISTKTPFIDQTPDKLSTENPLTARDSTGDFTEVTTSTDETSTSTPFDASAESIFGNMNDVSGSGSGEPESRISNCTDTSEDCYQTGLLGLINKEFENDLPGISTDSDVSYSWQTESNADTSTDNSTPSSEGTTSTTSTSSDTEASTQDVTANEDASSEKYKLSTSEETSELDSTGIMAADMPKSDEMQEEASTTIDTWTDSDQSTSQSNTKILPNVLHLMDNRTAESFKTGLGDSNDTTEEISTSTDGETDSTVTTESSTAPSSTEGDGYEASATMSTDYGSSDHTAAETTTDSTTSSSATETATFDSSTSETSTTQTFETSSLSTETEADTTSTTEISS